MSLMQSEIDLPSNCKYSKTFCYSYLHIMMLSCSLTWNSTAGESFSNNWDQRCNDETIMQRQKVFTGFQTSRTNSFDSSSCEDLIQSFFSQIPNSDGAPMPLSPRKWFKIKVAFKLASMGRVRASRRGLHCPAPRSRLVQTI